MIKLHLRPRTELNNCLEPMGATIPNNLETFSSPSLDRRYDPTRSSNSTPREDALIVKLPAMNRHQYACTLDGLPPVLCDESPPVCLHPRRIATSKP
ncbi:hypothetical protein AAP_06387 [Ascosphaera apis ARSEF 7405]|uniref:Uncharacterized protein n=1 Tax=Ascosphaera apis ARSEF 7405 TaxID=392613 RepID=A0A167UUG7_9EURO|nr:hypothetical protein AAP_06387 [Ascosphaera apis ARSEF 7405]